MSVVPPATGGGPRAKATAAPVSLGNAASLEGLLNMFRVEKGEDFTHTSFQRPAAAVYIPSSCLRDFYECYRAAMRRGDNLHITENHRPIGPVLADFDLRFPATEAELVGKVPPVRRYTEEDVQTFVSCISSSVVRYVLPPTTHFEVFVMEKPGPTLDKNTGLVKDGLHFVVPDIVTRPVVQHRMREALLADPQFRTCMQRLAPTKPLDDVVDKAVIADNCWTMYGSKKPGAAPYVVTRVYAYHVASEELTPCPVAPWPDEHHNYVERLSIRNKYTETLTRPEKRAEVEELQAQQDERNRQRNAIRRAMVQMPQGPYNTVDCLHTVTQLVGILNVRRADNYADWIRLGWCLRNIDYRLLDAWTEFSRSSAKYIEGETTKLWAINSGRPGGLGMGTLHMWAKQDNPAAYREIIRNDLNDLIDKSCTQTHYDVAKVVHHMYQYDYACANIDRKNWYEFRNHRWVPCDSVYTLKVRMSTEVFAEYMARCAHHNLAVTRPGMDEATQLMHVNKSSRLNRVANSLKNQGFKDALVKACAELFYREKFEELLDSNPNLLGFNNGVFDLDHMEFREGRPDDYISLTTGIDYVPYDKHHPAIKELETFWQQVHPNRAVREYVLRLFGSFLNGNTLEERFHIWTGSGSNGKSKVIDLFEMAMGEYCCKLPVTLLTQKRVASNAANSEVARLKGRRFASLQEPSEDERLNVGLMKELTGGDKIMARPMYKEPIEFRPQFKLVLLCNHLPHVPSDDGGTWRRIRLVEFGSKFVPGPPTQPCEFPIDPDLGKKLPRWAPYFMSMLIEFYRLNVVAPAPEPDEVLKCTNEYKQDNDHHAGFVENCIEPSPDARECVSMNDAFQEFKDWLRDEGIHKQPKKKDLYKHLEKALGRGVGSRANPAYYGFRLRDRYALPAPGNVINANNK